MKKGGTLVYARQHAHGLTLPQQSAVDLLASGKTDTEAAELLGLHRTTVSKWRAYDPAFQAALNRRRAEVWASGVDRLRSLVPKALDALADELDKPGSPNRLKAAGEILRLAQLPAVATLTTGPTEAEEIVRELVARRRQEAHDPLDDLLEEDKGLPPFDRHVAATWRELQALAAPAGEETTRPAGEDAGS
jgi:Homeodomain-like domain